MRKRSKTKIKKGQTLFIKNGSFAYVIRVLGETEDNIPGMYEIKMLGSDYPMYCPVRYWDMYDHWKTIIEIPDESVESILNFLELFGLKKL